MKAFSDHKILRLPLLILGLIVLLISFHVTDKNSPTIIRDFSGPGYVPFELNHFSIGMSPEDFCFWFSNRPQSLYTFQKAELAINRLPRKHKAEIRIRGTHAWNWDFRKPSFRIRLQGQQRILGHETLDFINPDDASMLANLVADNVATQLKLVSPRTRICTVALNNDYKGLYHLAEPINLVTLKNHDLNNHSMIEGNIRNSKMWHDQNLWQFEGPDPERLQKARKALKSMLEAVKTPVDLVKINDLSGLVDYDLTARWSALMSAIASIHTNDFLGNLLVFDHENNRFFPAIADSTGFGVISSMSGMHSEADIKVPIYEFLTPFLNALFRDPEFTYLRNLALYKLLQNQLEPVKLSGTVKKYLQVLEPMFYKEPYASALINVPLVLFSRKIPVSPEAQIADSQRLLDFMSARRQFILEKLDRCSLEIVITPATSLISGQVFKHVVLVISGHSPVDLNFAGFENSVLPDYDFDAQLDHAKADFYGKQLFYPALKESFGDFPHWMLLDRRFAGFVLEPEEQIYVIGISTEVFDKCLAHVQASAKNAITGKSAVVKIVQRPFLKVPQPAGSTLHSWRKLKNGQS